MAGYSHRPLAAKLGLREGMRAAVLNAPDDYRDTLGALPDGVALVIELEPALRFIQLFAPDRATLDRLLAPARDALASDGMLWVSWPKKASGRPTDLDGNIVRAAGLAAGLVDIKVCAVDETWSGLKFVYRREDRPGRLSSR